MEHGENRPVSEDDPLENAGVGDRFNEVMDSETTERWWQREIEKEPALAELKKNLHSGEHLIIRMTVVRSDLAVEAIRKFDWSKKVLKPNGWNNMTEYLLYRTRLVEEPEPNGIGDLNNRAAAMIYLNRRYRENVKMVAEGLRKRGSV